jgi:tetratricopeptide (TPR) repeat protein
MGEAEDAYNKSLEIKREMHDRVGEGIGLLNLGTLYGSHARWEEAEEAYQQSLIIHREFGDRVGEGMTLGSFAELRSRQGDIEGALQLDREALQVPESTQAEALKERARKQVNQLEQKLKEQKGNQAGS